MDRKCLISRAQCYQHLGEADKALADADETLREDNKYIKVLRFIFQESASFSRNFDLCWCLLY